MCSQLSLLQRPSGEPQDCELVSLMARVHYSGSLFQTNICRRRPPGDPRAHELVGRFSNDDDDDGNENVKKPIGLLSRTSRLQVHHAFWYISLPLLHDYDVKMPNFTFYGGRKQETRNFLSLSKLESSLQEINSKEICPH